MPTPSEPGNAVPPRDEHRELTVKAWLSAAGVLALVALAGWALVVGQAMFAVALVVLAVFAAVELASNLRRRG